MVPAWMLVTDVDGTLIGNQAALERLIDRTRSVPIPVVLNSSRPIDSINGRLEASGLPIVGVIGALGTEVEIQSRRDKAWAAGFEGFPASEIAAALRPFGDAHTDEFQTPHKVSFAIPEGSWAKATAAVTEVDGNVRVITSAHNNFDVIPISAGKTAASRYVAAKLQHPWRHVMTAGDAEIDAGMILSGNGIVVSNATPALVRTVGDRAFVATEAHAAGILQGIDHYMTSRADRG